jgi:hypothetical protein
MPRRCAETGQDWCVLQLVLATIHYETLCTAYSFFFPARRIARSGERYMFTNNERWRTINVKLQNRLITCSRGVYRL